MRKAPVEFQKWTVGEVVAHIISADQQLVGPFPETLIDAFANISQSGPNQYREKEIGKSWFGKSGLYNYYRLRGGRKISSMIMTS